MWFLRDRRVIVHSFKSTNECASGCHIEWQPTMIAQNQKRKNVCRSWLQSQLDCRRMARRNQTNPNGAYVFFSQHITSDSTITMNGINHRPSLSIWPGSHHTLHTLYAAAAFLRRQHLAVCEFQSETVWCMSILPSRSLSVCGYLPSPSMRCPMNNKSKSTSKFVRNILYFSLTLATRSLCFFMFLFVTQLCVRALVLHAYWVSACRCVGRSLSSYFRKSEMPREYDSGQIVTTQNDISNIDACGVV